MCNILQQIKQQSRPFVSIRFDAFSICRGRRHRKAGNHSLERCLHPLEELLGCTLVQVEANLVGHEHGVFVLLNQLLENNSNIFRLIEEDQTLTMKMNCY